MRQIRSSVFFRYCRCSLVAFSLIGVLSTLGCQDSQRRSSSSSRGSGDDASLSKSSGDVVGNQGDQSTYYDHSESFVAESLEIRTLGKPVHMYWIVDTTEKISEQERVYSWRDRSAPHLLSGKDMADEIAAIQTHLPPFIESLKKLSVVQVAMQSGFSPEIDTVMRTAVRYVDRSVMEAAGVRVLHNPRFYGDRLVREVGYSFSLDSSSSTSGPYSDFFRDPKALKVIIMVRDRGITAPYDRPANGISFNASRDFLKKLNRFSGNNLSSFRFFALIDLRDSYLNDLNRDYNRELESADESFKRSSIRPATNRFYDQMVKELGGEKYHTNNISSSEWTKVFDQLKSKIAEEVGGSVEKKKKATFTLQRPASKVLEVKVAGKALAKTSFQVTGTTLYIDAEHVSEGQNIAVKYQSTRSS